MEDAAARELWEALDELDMPLNPASSSLGGGHNHLHRNLIAIHHTSQHRYIRIAPRPAPETVSSVLLYCSGTSTLRPSGRRTDVQRQRLAMAFEGKGESAPPYEGLRSPASRIEDEVVVDTSSDTSPPLIEGQAVSDCVPDE